MIRTAAGEPPAPDRRSLTAYRGALTLTALTVTAMVDALPTDPGLTEVVVLQ